jgi:hypothetical protein
MQQCHRTATRQRAREKPRGSAEASRHRHSGGGGVTGASSTGIDAARRARTRSVAAGGGSIAGCSRKSAARAQNLARNV